MDNIVFLESVTFTIALLIYLAATILFFVYVIGRKDKVGKFGVNTTIVGLAVHSLSMIFRIIEAGRLPQRLLPRRCFTSFARHYPPRADAPIAR